MEHDVFISHAYQDRSVADAICEKLESAGVKCWTAARDAASDEENWTTTRNAIASSHLMVLVLSQNANAAPHIKREIAHAFYTRRIIVPFRLAGTLPRRDFLFYLSNFPYFDTAGTDPEQLKALTVHIKGLVAQRVVGGDAFPAQSTGKKAARSTLSKTSMNAQQTSHYRTLGLLRWGAIGTALFAVGWYLWFTLWQTKERMSLTENHPQSMYPGSSVSSEPSPQAGGESPPTKPTDGSTGSSVWQGPNGGPSSLVLQAPQEMPLLVPTDQSASVTSSPPSEVTAGPRAGQTSALEPHNRPLPPLSIHRAPHYHHPQNQAPKAEELHRNADLATGRSDALQSKLAATETKLQTSQKNAEVLAIQKDALQNELNESAARVQTVQKNAELAVRERDTLQDQLKEAEDRAIAAEKKEELANSERAALQKQLEESEATARAARNDGDLARRQLDALQTELKNTEAKAETAQKKAELATSQRDALETELHEAKERALAVEMHGNLAADQRNEMEAALKKAQLALVDAQLAATRQNEMEAQLKKAQEEKPQSARRDLALSGFYGSGPDTQFRKKREDAQPDHEEPDLATNQPQFGQMLPPNPAKNAKLAPLTQALDSSVQSARP